jgi:eukaryotic-like serine/threonine-protein kinase
MKQSYTINIPVRFFWKVLLPGLFIVAVVGAIAGVIIVDKVIMPNVVGVDRDVVEVPNVVRLSYEDCREKLFQVGLLTEIRAKEYDDTIPENAVVTQMPAAGSRVKKSRKIAVVISKGKEVAVIPDVRNITERQARITLKKDGFTLGRIRKVYSKELPVDVVINAFPKCGTTTSREIEVDLYVSKGPKPTHAVVPNLVGESLKNAKLKIAESELVPGKISYKNNPSLLPGTIISQSAAPGSRVPLESRLNLVVSVIR